MGMFTDTGSLFFDDPGSGTSDIGTVGPNSDGTYNVPAEALPSNTPWDTAGNSVGNYGSDVIGLLRDGIGAWSQNQNNQQFLDYQRFEATQGGVYRQGVPANGLPVTVAARATMSPLMLIMIGGVVLLLLRK